MKSKGLLIIITLFITSLIFPQTPCPNTPTVTYEGKTYNTVQIGNQCWLKENLDVGTMIPGNQNQNNNGTIEKYCFKDNPSNCTTYGGLYQWDEAMNYKTAPGTQGICPSGWHVPTDTEFGTLLTAVNNDGNALKEIGQGAGDGAGTNTSGFSALLAGGRADNGKFANINLFTWYWSSKENNTTYAHPMILGFRQIDVSNNSNNMDYKVDGYSIRCIKDNQVPPSAPTQSSPTNNQTDVNISPTFTWLASDFSTSYTLQVSTNNSFSSFVYNQNGLTGTSQQLSGLNNLTIYYWRVSATNSYGTSSWSSVWSFTTSECGTPIIYLGKTYNTIQIGTQCWFKENLDVGTMIQGNQTQTNNSTIEKYCYNNDLNNCAIYGGLYQWDEAMQYVKSEKAKGICPTGWHLPTIAQFQTLRTFVNTDGNALKSIGQGAGTNTSGFSALLSGFLGGGGNFGNLGATAMFWTSTEGSATKANNYTLYSDVNFYQDETFTFLGYSVRCIRDEVTVAVEENNGKNFPTKYLLSQNYPNPFNPTTRIGFYLPVRTITRLVVYDIQGRIIFTLVNQELSSGYHEINFDGSKLTSGIYFYTISAGSFVETKKMILLK